MPDNDVVSRVDIQSGITIKTECEGNMLHCHLLYPTICNFLDRCGSGRPPAESLYLPCGACEDMPYAPGCATGTSLTPLRGLPRARLWLGRTLSSAAHSLALSFMQGAARERLLSRWESPQKMFNMAEEQLRSAIAEVAGQGQSSLLAEGILYAALGECFFCQASAARDNADHACKRCLKYFRHAFRKALHTHRRLLGSDHPCTRNVCRLLDGSDDTDSASDWQVPSVGANQQRVEHLIGGLTAALRQQRESRSDEIGSSLWDFACAVQRLSSLPLGSEKDAFWDEVVHVLKAKEGELTARELALFCNALASEPVYCGTVASTTSLSPRYVNRLAKQVRKVALQRDRPFQAAQLLESFTRLQHNHDAILSRHIFNFAQEMWDASAVTALCMALAGSKRAARHPLETMETPQGANAWGRFAGRCVEVLPTAQPWQLAQLARCLGIVGAPKAQVAPFYDALEDSCRGGDTLFELLAEPLPYSELETEQVALLFSAAAAAAPVIGLSPALQMLRRVLPRCRALASSLRPWQLAYIAQALDVLGELRGKDRGPLLWSDMTEASELLEELCQRTEEVVKNQEKRQQICTELRQSIWNHSRRRLQSPSAKAENPLPSMQCRCHPMCLGVELRVETQRSGTHGTSQGQCCSSSVALQASQNRLVQMLQTAAHPATCVFHAAFKIVVLLIYIYGRYIHSAYVSTFILCTIFAALDFWTVKNISGRLLVGLRWWNLVKDDGSSEWVFESNPDEGSLNATDRSIFWGVTYVWPVLWAVFLFMNILNFSLDWVLLNIMIFVFAGTNLAGYWKCSTDAKKRATQWVQSEGMRAVWSNSRNKWLPAVVHGVYLQATTTEGFDVPPGSVKVLSEAGVKWVLADSVAVVLRKVALEESFPSKEAKGAPGPSARLCKNNCGRAVQPGLTRGLKPYDTCCKRCAQSPGSNEHDENCGGRHPDRSPSVPSLDLQQSLRSELEAMLKEPAALEEIVKGAFARSGKPIERLSWEELREPLEALLQPFGVHLGVKDRFLEHLCQTHGQDEDAQSTLCMANCMSCSSSTTKVSQIMEPCYGGELQDKVNVLRKTGKAPYDEAFVCDVMKQTLRALAFMHKKPFLHKEIIASSIKVIDFGLAELFNPQQKFANFIGGTRLYMAPEVFRQQMTIKTDIWSAGVILYNLMTGDFPFLAQWPPPKGKDEAWWEEQTILKIKNEQPVRPDVQTRDHRWAALVCIRA
eukprot:g21337.t1